MSPIYQLYSSLPLDERHHSCAEIDLDALAENWSRLCAAARQDRPLRPIAVVKADAYGHGAPACVRTLLREGCDFFAVSCLEEAIAVRAVCRDCSSDADVLILGYTPAAHVRALASEDLIQTLLSEEYAETLNAAAKKEGVRLRTHVAVDTGMNRIGLPTYSEKDRQRTADAIRRVCALPSLSVEGMFTHFACADEPKGEEMTALQANRYRQLCSLLEALGVRIPFHHVCNSAATLRFRSLHFDGVRLGIALYGVSPFPTDPPALLPVLRPTTRIVHLHRLPAGESVGYGATYRATDERCIATLPIGYADGILRAYSGAEVTLHARTGDVRVPIVGRVCMDQCMIDVTGTDAREGDRVTLFGGSPDELSAYARRANTIEYEVLCLLSARLPRKYISKRTEVPLS